MVLYVDMDESLTQNETLQSNKRVKKAAPVKAAAPVVEQQEVEVLEEETPVAKKSPVPEKNVAKATSGKKFVYFASGSAYVTKSGFRFSSEKRVYEVPSEEADHLLSLDNFRLPDQLELEAYYKENN
jgi:hypothetical protein